ncbi:MAG: hypothetical protein ABSB89_09985 [Candidatus Bathyarchaeia archaeon]|jgi:hypothetical protein
MSGTVKRGFSSMSFWVRKIFHKIALRINRAITTVNWSSLVVPTLAIALAVFLFAGGVYDLILRPPVAGFFPFGYVIGAPSGPEQFLSDSMLVAIAYSLGAIGLLAMHRSTSYVYKPRKAYVLLIIGLALALMAYIFIETAIQVRLTNQGTGNPFVFGPYL